MHQNDICAIPKVASLRHLCFLQLVRVYREQNLFPRSIHPFANKQPDPRHYLSNNFRAVMNWSLLQTADVRMMDVFLRGYLLLVLKYTAVIYIRCSRWMCRKLLEFTVKVYFNFNSSALPPIPTQGF